MKYSWMRWIFSLFTLSGSTGFFAGLNRKAEARVTYRGAFISYHNGRDRHPLMPVASEDALSSENGTRIYTDFTD